LIFLGADTDLLSWEKLSGLSGAAILALGITGFLTGKIVAGYLYREAITDRDKWSLRADDSTKLLRQSLDANEASVEQVRVVNEKVQVLTEQVRVLTEQLRDLKQAIVDRTKGG
jgi:hypothetical protein